MKILELITGVGVGGAETQLLSVAKLLRERGHEVQIVSLIPVDANHFTRGAECEILSLGVRRGYPDIRAIFRLLKIVDQFKPDVIHAHMHHANILARSIRLFRSQAVIVSTYHNISEGGIHRDLLLRLTDPLSDCLAHVCEGSFKRRILSPPSKRAIIQNGIDCERFSSVTSSREQLRERLKLDGFVWLIVARLDKQKDYECMLRAFSQVVRRVGSGVRLVALGDGPERRKVERLIAGLQLAPFVDLRGERSDVDSFYLAADAFVLSSAWEGFPNVLLEAGVAKLPVVSTDVGGVSEIIADKSMGVLVPARDPSALAEAMMKVMKMDSGERARLGAKLRSHIEEDFAIDKVVSKWEKLYEELLEKRRGYLKSRRPGRP